MRFLFLLFISISILSTSCFSPQNLAEIYYPIPANIPSLDAKNDLHVNATYFDWDTTGRVGFNTQIAWSPIDHLGLLGSYHFQKNKLHNDFERHKIEAFEVGIGFYKGAEPDVEHLFNVDLFTGMSFYKGIDHKFVDGINPNSGLMDGWDKFQSNSREFWIQTGLHYNKRGDINLKIGGTVRLAHAKMYQIHHISNLRPIDDINPTFTTLQVGHDLRFGLDYALLKVQFGFTFFMDALSQDNAHLWVTDSEGTGLGYFMIGAEFPLNKIFLGLFKSKK